MDFRQLVLENISEGSPIIHLKKNLAKVNGKIIHYRYKSKASDMSRRFPFNINPTTLSADFEIWICGNQDLYFIIPIKEIKKIYDDPDTYTNSTKNQSLIKTLTVDTLKNVAKYGRNSKALDVSSFKNKTLNYFF